MRKRRKKIDVQSVNSDYSSNSCHVAACRRPSSFLYRSHARAGVAGEATHAFLTLYERPSSLFSLPARRWNSAPHRPKKFIETKAIQSNCSCPCLCLALVLLADPLVLPLAPQSAARAVPIIAARHSRRASPRRG